MYYKKGLFSFQKKKISRLRYTTILKQYKQCKNLSENIMFAEYVKKSKVRIRTGKVGTVLLNYIRG